jgi:hypothetical protein
VRKDFQDQQRILEEDRLRARPRHAHRQGRGGRSRASSRAGTEIAAAYLDESRPATSGAPSISTTKRPTRSSKRQAAATARISAS